MSTESIDIETPELSVEEWAVRASSDPGATGRTVRRGDRRGSTRNVRDHEPTLDVGSKRSRPRRSACCWERVIKLKTQGLGTCVSGLLCVSLSATKTEGDNMPGTWFIGDTHFGHQKVSEIRGFADTPAHDEAIVRRWERQVGPDDLVYVLGDISGGSRTGEADALDIISHLPGHKILISGNHDSVSSIHRKRSPHLSWFREVFEDIKDFSRIRVQGQDVLLSHYPYWSQGDGGRANPRYSQYRLPDLGSRLIHAHTHHTSPTEGSFTGREICVSWDAWRRMVNIGDIAKWIHEEDTP